MIPGVLCLLALLELYNPAARFRKGPFAPGSIVGYYLPYDGTEPSPATPAFSLQRPNAPAIPLESDDAHLYLPESLTPGPARIVARTPDRTFAADVDIAPAAPALYTWNTGLLQPSSGAPLTHPIRPGSTFTLRGVGLGNADSRDLTAFLGDQQLVVTWAGRAPAPDRGYDLYEIDVPRDALLPDTCYAEFRLMLAGSLAHSGLIAASGPCRHPLPLTPRQLATLDAGEPIEVAHFDLATTAVQSDDGTLGTTTSVSAGLQKKWAAGLAPFAAAKQPSPGCAVLREVVSRPDIPSAVARYEPWNGPSLGPSMLLEGPDARYPVRILDSGPFGLSYGFDQPVAPWAAGTWTFSGPGDSSVEPFRVRVESTGPLRLRDTPTALRTRDFHLEWETANMADNDTIRVLLATPQPEAILCTVRALDGSVVIPARMLQELGAGRDASPEWALLIDYGRFAPPSLLPRRDADPLPATASFSGSIRLRIPVP